VERLALRVEQHIRSGLGDWEALALEIFQYQFEKNAPYGAYCRSLGQSRVTVKRWQDIPAVPVQAFKSVDLVTFLPNHAAAHFESSGTTQQTPSRHYLKTLTFYEMALKKSFREHVLASDAKIPMIIAAPAPAEAPRSSLSWMFEVVKNKWGEIGSQYFVQQGRLNEVKLAFSLRKAQEVGKPVLLLGTTVAWLALFDELDKTQRTLNLPKGSRLLDTGGMKTSKRLLTREAFVDLVQEKLGIAEADCVSEYGMCEMSSQFYGYGKSTYLEGPAWVKTEVVDGLLRHYDLANVDSVLALQTQDLGRLEGKGFHLLGRASEADAKGCSLSAEAFLN